MDVLIIEEPGKPASLIWSKTNSDSRRDVSVGFLPKEPFDKTICFYTNEETELENTSERDTTYMVIEACLFCETHQIRRGQYRCIQETEKRRGCKLINQSQNQFQIESD